MFLRNIISSIIAIQISVLSGRAMGSCLDSLEGLTSYFSENGLAVPKIRVATAKDVPLLVDIDREAFGKDGYKASYFRELFEDGSIAIIAERGGTVLGDGLYFFDENEQTGNIESLATLKPYQSQKIGRFLMFTMIQDLTKLHAKNVTLQVEKGNTNAITLYEKMGFTHTGEEENYYGKGRDALLMELVIGAGQSSN